MKKSNLFEELNIEEPKNFSYTALDTDIQSVKRKVTAKITSASKERKSKIMRSKKRIPIIVVAAAFALCITAFAASGFVKTWLSSSSAIPDYKTLPSEERIVKDIGYKAVLVDAFANGYAFKDGNVVNNEFSDENGSSVEKFKSVSFRYEKEGDIVYFSQDKFGSEIEKHGEIIATENGCDLYYYSYTNKLVPPNYKLTEKDKKAEENGELVFSYGASDVEICAVQSISWKKDGVLYQLLQMDGRLSENELCNMAKEIVNK